jgi:hypothetical protein
MRKIVLIFAVAAVMPQVLVGMDPSIVRTDFGGFIWRKTPEQAQARLAVLKQIKSLQAQLLAAQTPEEKKKIEDRIQDLQKQLQGPVPAQLPTTPQATPSPATPPSPTVAPSATPTTPIVTPTSPADMIDTFMEMCAKGSATDIAKYLNVLNVAVQRPSDGATGLMIAAKEGQTKVIDLLLPKINVYIKDKNGKTALNWAIDGIQKSKDGEILNEKQQFVILDHLLSSAIDWPSVDAALADAIKVGAKRIAYYLRGHREAYMPDTSPGMMITQQMRSRRVLNRDALTITIPTDLDIATIKQQISDLQAQREKLKTQAEKNLETQLQDLQEERNQLGFEMNLGPSSFRPAYDALPINGQKMLALQKQLGDMKTQAEKVLEGRIETLRGQVRQMEQLMQTWQSEAPAAPLVKPPTPTALDKQIADRIKTLQDRREAMKTQAEKDLETQLQSLQGQKQKQKPFFPFIPPKILIPAVQAKLEAAKSQDEKNLEKRIQGLQEELHQIEQMPKLKNGVGRSVKIGQFGGKIEGFESVDNGALMTVRLGTTMLVLGDSGAIPATPRTGELFITNNLPLHIMMSQSGQPGVRAIPQGTSIHVPYAPGIINLGEDRIVQGN